VYFPKARLKTRIMMAAAVDVVSQHKTSHSERLLLHETFLCIDDIPEKKIDLKRLHRS
jgi:hypothetical protein